MRWIVATMSDSGMRLAELIGLQKDDLSFDVDIPFLRLLEHPWRRLKTSTSKRDVSLIGAALWGLKPADLRYRSNKQKIEVSLRTRSESIAAKSAATLSDRLKGR